MNLYEEISGLLARRDFKSIGDLLYLPNCSTRPSRENSRYLQQQHIVKQPPFGQPILLPQPYQSLVEKFLTAVGLMQTCSGAWSVANLQPILNSCREFFNESIEYFALESTGVEEGEWFLRAATSNYIYIGLLISKAGEAEVDGDERIGEVFHSIKKCLAQMNKKEESKRRIIIFLFAECFKLMFKLKRLGLFPSLLTSLQVLQADKLVPRARKSDAVQFLFYRALYEFHGQKFREAWDRFKDTWNLLHAQDWTHRRRVAVYLIAIALCHGKFPTNEFLRLYKLDGDLQGIKDSIMSGNLNSFRQQLSVRAASLHQSLNIYVFLLLNAQPAVHLNLVKRTWKLTGKSRVLSFEQIGLVARSYGLLEISADELECILMNLLGKGWIKGRLGHDSQSVILNPQDPFPIILK